MAQDTRFSVLLQLSPCVHKQKLVLDEEFELNEQKTTIETFKFYISNITLLKDEKPVWREENYYHLVDASVERSLQIELKLAEMIAFDSIRFDLGIDSLTNVSGVRGGDLDPTKGMYWTWQSGYINFKLEGINPFCAARNHRFQFHLGGYLPPYESIQAIGLGVVGSDTINIRVDVAEFLGKIDFTAIHTVMSPGKEAQELAQIAKAIFYCDEK